MQKRMLKIRFVEESIAERYSEGKMRCPTHLSIGQESVASASGLALNKKETELLIEMIFQLGIKGCLKFKNLLKNMRKGNKYLVCFEMMDSLWYKQTPERVKILIKNFLNNASSF